MTTAVTAPGIPGSSPEIGLPRLDLARMPPDIARAFREILTTLHVLQLQFLHLTATGRYGLNQMIAQEFVKTVTGVAPSATLNTFGTASVQAPPSGYATLRAFAYIALTSGGTFGAETLSVRLTLTFNDNTTTTITKTFVAAGVETALTAAELFALMKNGLFVTQAAVATASSINSSTATGGLKLGAWTV